MRNETKVEQNFSEKEFISYSSKIKMKKISYKKDDKKSNRKSKNFVFSKMSYLI